MKACIIKTLLWTFQNSRRFSCFSYKFTDTIYAPHSLLILGKKENGKGKGKGKTKQNLKKRDYFVTSTVFMAELYASFLLGAVDCGRNWIYYYFYQKNNVGVAGHKKTKQMSASFIKMYSGNLNMCDKVCDINNMLSFFNQPPGIYNPCYAV